MEVRGIAKEGESHQREERKGGRREGRSHHRGERESDIIEEGEFDSIKDGGHLTAQRQR